MENSRPKQKIIDGILNNRVNIRITKGWSSSPTDIDFSKEKALHHKAPSLSIKNFPGSIDALYDEIESNIRFNETKSVLSTVFDDFHINDIIPVAWSDFFNEDININLKKYDEYTDVFFEPSMIEYGNRVIEFRTTGLNAVNIYDPESQNIYNILTYSDGFESLLDFALVPFEESQDYELFYNEDADAESSDEKNSIFSDGLLYNLECFIPQERNMSYVLSYSRDRLMEYGIDVDDLTGKNSLVYVDGKRIDFKEELKERPLAYLLSSNQSYQFPDISLEKSRTRSKDKISYEK